MNIKVKPCNRSNYGNIRQTTAYIVIHYTGNDKDTAKGNASYFANNYVGASANYFVDDNDIYESVPEKYTAWHCETRGMAFKCSCRNNNSIGIELCTCGDYQISDKTAQNAAELVKLLMEKYKLSPNRVIRHYDVCGKLCPKPWVNDILKWQNFKEMLSDMTEAQVSKICNDMIYKHNKNLEDKLVTFINNKIDSKQPVVYNKLEDVPAWAVDTVTKFVEGGILRGDGSNLNISEDMLRILVMVDRILQ